MASNQVIQHIHLDLVGGIAGDMFVSALTDLFPNFEQSVLNSVKLILPHSAGHALFKQGLNGGISGRHFSLDTLPAADNHAHQHTHGDGHSHHHTTYQHLCKLLTQSDLSRSIVALATELLTIIAQAEAKIHSKTLADVHFHEIADWDSLMDVVASAVILDELKETSWSISDLPLGGGLVKTQHGLIPVPAPATAEILADFTFKDDGIEGERVTPTGASILRYLANNKLITHHKAGTLKSTGYGLGTKILPGMPNILRANLFTQELSTIQQHTVVIIEFDIDDMTGEELALSFELIRQRHGVIDLISISAKGKKNRATELVRILATSEAYQDVIDYCFIQTTTIGLRYRFETRKCLSRELHQSGNSQSKTVTRPDGNKTTKIEHDQLVSFPTLEQRRARKVAVEYPKS